MVIAAGHFKQTQVAAYGEALINIALSLVLIKPFGLLGVAIGTLVASAGRLIYYAIYLRQNVFNREVNLFVKREIVNIGSLALICFLGKFLTKVIKINTYFVWAGVAISTIIIAISVTLVGNYVFFKLECKEILVKMRHIHQ